MTHRKLHKNNKTATGLDRWSRLHKFVLDIESWGKEVPYTQRKVMIAEALNTCTYHRYLKVIGYLITVRKVFLIIETQDYRLEDALRLFYECIADSIHHYLREERELDQERCEEYQEIEEKHIAHHDLFKRYPFDNEYLLKLIIGQEIDLLYYSPYLAKLKDQIHDYNYCSALDYRGAKSPVTITKLSEF